MYAIKTQWHFVTLSFVFMALVNKREWRASLGAQASCLPMILSAFSHYGSLHLLCNMMVLHSFMGPAVHLLGPEQFLAVYLSAGVLSSMASLTYKVATRQSSPLPLVELQRGLALIGRELHDIANTLMPRISEDVQS